MKYFCYIVLLFTFPFSLQSNPEYQQIMSDENFYPIADVLVHKKILYNADRRKILPEDIEDGSIIYVFKKQSLDYFLYHIHPHIQTRYILLTYMCKGTGYMGGYRSLLEDPKVLAWMGHIHDEKFIQQPKFHPLPLGVKVWGKNKKSTRIIASKKNSEPLEKEYLAYLNVRDTHSVRKWITQFFKDSPFVTHSPIKQYPEFLDDLKKSKFVFCPRGVNFDSFRTWETLLMGSIPIIKRDPFSYLYEDLPVLIVDDYSEVTEDFLLRKYEEISQQTYNFDKLYIGYWKEYIFEFLREHGFER